MNYFTYNGIKSSDMGLMIKSKNAFSAPKYDAIFKSIPGRNGDLILPSGRFPNIQITYTVFVAATTISDLAKKITAIKAWLYSEPDSYHILSDTYDNIYFRQGVYSGALDIEDQLNKIGSFTVAFSCKPFRYRVDGQEITEIITSGTEVINPEAFISKPYIRINGTGDITLTLISSAQSHSWTFSNVDGYVECDSELMNFYKGTVLKNDTVTGDGFPLLYPGINSVNFTGSVTSIEIIPKWVTL